MARLFETRLKDGSMLTRMTRPPDWDQHRWCQEPDCNEPCASVYGWQEPGQTSWIGWRAACSRKHALSVWRREVQP